MRSHCTQKRNAGNAIGKVLQRAGIARLDAELLLAHALEKPRTWLLVHPETPLSPPQLRRFDALVARRKNHEPVAYITGEKEFYGRLFFVDRRVMIPRPSTETLIDEVKRVFGHPNVAPLRTTVRTPQVIEADNDIVIFSEIFSPSDPFCVIDVGTGSGCIGITLALEFPEAKVVCTDISDDAIEVARKNAKRHGALERIAFQRADLIPSLDTVPLRGTTRDDTPFIVVSNPPYVPTTERDSLPSDVRDYEPHEALFAGQDGMAVLRPLYEHCRQHPLCIGCVLEMRLKQAKKCSSL